MFYPHADIYFATGSYPTKITVVGYEFKRRRFEQLHRAALRYASPPLSLSHSSSSPTSRKRPQKLPSAPQRARVTVAKDDGRNVNEITKDQFGMDDGARGSVMADVTFEYVGLGLGAGREEEEREAKKGEVCRPFLALPHLSTPIICVCLRQSNVNLSLSLLPETSYLCFLLISIFFTSFRLFGPRFLLHAFRLIHRSIHPTTARELVPPLPLRSLRLPPTPLHQTSPTQPLGPRTRISHIRPRAGRVVRVVSYPWCA